MRYRFLHQAEGRYFWQSVLPLPNDIRHELVSCAVSWFWGHPEPHNSSTDNPITKD